jgi:hypothetical protein
MGDNNNDDLVKSSPLWVLRKATLNRLGQQLNHYKVLQTEDGRCRDWRGLVDFDLVGLDIREKDTVKDAKTKNKTGM